MHASHAHALDAARYASLAVEDHAAGVLRPLPNYARRAIAACHRAQLAAEVPGTTADFTAALDAFKSPEEQLEEAEREARFEREYEEQQRAKTGMDATNRAKQYRDVGIAEEVIPRLGWSRQMVQVVRNAAARRVWLDSTGTARLINRAGAPGRVVAADRIRLLRQAGYLYCENDRAADTYLLATAESRRVLYLADLFPGGIHRDDRAAHAARLKAALTRRRGKQDARNEAARLPGLDRWAMRHADDLPVTLPQQQEASAEQRRAEAKKSAQKVCTETIEKFAGRIAHHLGDGWALTTEQNPYHQNVRYLYLVHTDGRRLRVKGERRGGDERGVSLPAEKLAVWAIYPDTDRPIRSDERSNASVTIARGPEVIARHLNGERFMGRYVRTLKAICAFDAERERDKAGLESLGQQLADTFAHGATVTASPYSCEIEARGHSRAYAAKIYNGQVSLDIGHMPMNVAIAVTAAYDCAITATHGAQQPALEPRPVASTTPEAGAQPVPDEEPSGTWPEGPVEELVRQIADHLGEGWTVQIDANPYFDGTGHAYLVHRDCRKVEIEGDRRGWDSKGNTLPVERVRAWGVFPPTERRFRSNERPETTAAITRGGKAIAKQLIDDRFMGRYTRALQAVVDYNTDQAARTAAMRAQGQQLAELLAHGASVIPTYYACEVRSLRENRKYVANVLRYGVCLELGYMPPSVALAVTAAYEAGMTDHLRRRDVAGPMGAN